MCPRGPASTTTATAMCSTNKTHCKPCVYEHAYTIPPLSEVGEAAALLRLKKDHGSLILATHFDAE